MSSGSIEELLSAWPFDPATELRFVTGADGRERLQVRLELGILQMELDGRPDGTVPYGFRSLLDYHRQRFEDHCRQHGGPEGYRLEADDCEQLRAESAQFYQRYYALFRMGRFEPVVHDTARNLRCLDFLNQYAASQDDRLALEQYRPYVLSLNALARLEGPLAEGDYDGALQILDVARAGIADFLACYEGQFSAQAELELLRERRAQVVAARPASEADRLGRLRDEAVAREDYEAAARYRDELQRLLDDQFPKLW